MSWVGYRAEDGALVEIVEARGEELVGYELIRGPRARGTRADFLEIDEATPEELLAIAAEVERERESAKRRRRELEARVRAERQRAREERAKAKGGAAKGAEVAKVAALNAAGKAASVVKPAAVKKDDAGE